MGPQLPPRFRGGILRIGKDLFAEFPEQGLQHAADGAEIRDVGIEHPDDVDDLGGDRLRVLDAVDGILLQEIGFGVREHLFDLGPAEGRDGDREGETLEVVDSSADILGQRAGQGRSGRLDVRGEVRNADGRQVHQVRRDIEFLQGRARQVADRAGGLLDLFMGGAGDFPDLTGRIGDCAIGVLGDVPDKAADLVRGVLDGADNRTGRALQGLDELLRKLDLHGLLPDDAEEVQDRIGLGQDARHLVVDIPDLIGRLAVQGVVDVFPDICSERVVYVLHVVHALAEEGLRQRGGLVGILFEFLEVGLDFPFDLAAYVLDGAVDLLVEGVRLELDILDLVGEHLPAIAEDRDEDVFQEGHREVLQAELLPRVTERLFQLSADLAHLHVLEILDQLHEILERLVDGLGKGPVVRFPLPRHFFDALGEVVDEGQRLREQVHEVLRIVAVADVHADLREDGLDDLFAAVEDVLGSLEGVLHVGRSALRLVLHLFEGFPQAGKLFFEVFEQCVPGFLQQEDDLVGDVLEGSHGSMEIGDIQIYKEKITNPRPE